MSGSKADEVEWQGRSAKEKMARRNGRAVWHKEEVVRLIYKTKEYWVQLQNGNRIVAECRGRVAEGESSVAEWQKARVLQIRSHVYNKTPVRVAPILR